MGHTQTAVGCAVGIPIGVGIIIAAIFWVRLQRRFKKEMEDDKELEHAIYDESGFINFDNFDSLKQDHPGTTMTDLELHPTTSNDNNGNPAPPTRSQRKGHANAYVPAYRKRINSMQVRATRMSSFNNPSDSNNSLFNCKNPNNSSVTSMSESLQLQQQQQMHQQHQQGYKQTTMSNMYNQMVPMVETLNNESYFTKPATIGGSSPGTPLPAGADANTTHHSTSFLMGNDSSQISGEKEGVQLSTLYHNSDLDLGSYYPRRPTNPAAADASSEI